MITDRKIQAYIEFRGDDDMWARTASDENKKMLTDDDWGVISTIQMELIQLDSGLVSQKYQEEIEERLAFHKCSAGVLSELMAMK